MPASTPARRHRGRLALRQGRARHDGLRQPLRRRAGRIVRRGRRQAAPPQLRRGGREPDRQRGIPLDGRQLPEVRDVGIDVRQHERRRPSRRRARVDRAVRPPADLHQLRRPRKGRRKVARPAGQLHGRGRVAARLPPARREGHGRCRGLPHGEDAAGEHGPARWPARLASARRRAHRSAELALLHRVGRQVHRSHGATGIDRGGAGTGRRARGARRSELDDRARAAGREGEGRRHRRLLPRRLDHAALGRDGLSRPARQLEDRTSTAGTRATSGGAATRRSTSCGASRTASSTA